MAGSDVGAIHEVRQLLNTFNLSGDLLPMTQDGGPTDSSYPWDDPTDPYDPNDATNPDDPRCQPASLDSCGLGFELVLWLPPVLWLRRRRSNA